MDSEEVSFCSKCGHDHRSHYIKTYAAHKSGDYSFSLNPKSVYGCDECNCRGYVPTP